MTGKRAVLGSKMVNTGLGTQCSKSDRGPFGVHKQEK